MKRKIEKWDFMFTFAGYGHYKVVYTSPVTAKTWSTITNNMPLIDSVLHQEEPKRKDLEKLKRLCKSM